MNELRHDRIHPRRWIVLTPKRAKRHLHRLKGKTCVFCPGSEELLSEGIITTKDRKGNWMVKVLPNKFPAFSLKYPRAYGLHWVIIETPHHGDAFHDLTQHHMEKVIETYVLAMKKMLKTKDIRYVLLFKNEGREAGTSQDHMHSQMIGTNKKFPHVEEELETCRKYWEEHHRCIYCDEIKRERKSPRFVYKNRDFIAFCPYASLYPYNTIVFPLKHMPDFTKMSKNQMSSLADIMKKVLTAIATLGVGFNFYLHTSHKKYHHFHIEIRPRPNIFAGFELGSGIVINTEPPEEAAKYLRKKIRKRR
jgi:UDPglucose--hexose-1-phosphate uridylyltransferase